MTQLWYLFKAANYSVFESRSPIRLEIDLSLKSYRNILFTMISASINLVRAVFGFTVTILITHLEIGEHRREIEQSCQNIIEIQPLVNIAPDFLVQIFILPDTFWIETGDHSSLF